LNDEMEFVTISAANADLPTPALPIKPIARLFFDDKYDEDDEDDEELELESGIAI